MTKIDIIHWKKFRIGGKKGLFTIVSGKGITQKEIYLHPGELSAVQSGEDNFGIIGLIDETYCKNQGYAISNIACLTVARSGSVGFVGYQPQKCVVGDSAKLLIPNTPMSENVLLFLRTLLMEIKKKYAYNDKVTNERYSKEEIPLPVTNSGSPDWKFMDKYMSNVIQASAANLKMLIQPYRNKQIINIVGWKKFHLYDTNLFDIDMGTKLDKVKMTEINPTVNFVGRANANNGITATVDAIEGLKPYDAGCMTVSLGGEYLGSCFIQPKPFYTSQNVIVLIPKWDMSFEIKEFISTMIFKESQIYYKAFVDELNRHVKEDFSFWLPATSTGKPNWKYMDDCMRTEINTSKLYIKQIQKCMY